MKPIESTDLADMTIRILERTAMVLAEPADSDAGQPAPSRFARIAFQGPTNGTLTVCASDDFLCEVAAGLLGAEPSDVDVSVQGLDALKEMANMLGGSVILALSGETCEYSLGLPEIVAAAPAASRTACTVVGDGGVLKVMLADTSALPAKAA
jgi:CheY-specific phosphatase CheX